ncbi:MAG: pyroglutamyl-peptidase I [Oscillospiraceae bacterium]|jgi:pyroglutamyl-peptidase|nr:pyroglutamyl-peptidase I [Oscillospiraceae bacterium]
MKILITGFEPFGGETINPSWEAVEKLPKKIGETTLVKAQLPVEFIGAGERTAELYYKEAPAAILCVGQAGGRSAISIEQVALNLMDSEMPDNAGFCPKGLPVAEGGPDGLFARLPARALKETLCQAGIPAEVSLSAGTYVCNALMYRVMTLLQEGEQGGFIHLPFLPAQAAGKSGRPSMTLEMMVQGLSMIIEQLSIHP